MNSNLADMSMRAREYALECIKDFTGDEPVCFMDYYTEKLAELISNRCAALAYSYDPYELVPQKIARMIAEHFQE